MNFGFGGGVSSSIVGWYGYVSWEVICPSVHIKST